MKCLFKQLSDENQLKVRESNNSHLLISLQAKSYKHTLTIKDMMDLSETLGVDFGILAVTKLFES